MVGKSIFLAGYLCRVRLYIFWTDNQSDDFYFCLFFGHTDHLFYKNYQLDCHNWNNS